MSGSATTVAAPRWLELKAQTRVSLEGVGHPILVRELGQGGGMWLCIVDTIYGRNRQTAVSRVLRRKSPNLVPPRRCLHGHTVVSFWIKWAVPSHCNVLLWSGWPCLSVNASRSAVDGPNRCLVSFLLYMPNYNLRMGKPTSR